MIRERLRELLTLNESPHKIAMSFSAGVFIGMSPLFGIHTVLGILAAWLFRLNKMATIVGVYITNPWTIVPIYTFSTWLGARLLGAELIVPDVNWAGMNMKILLKELRHLLEPFVLGTVVVGVISSLLSYLIIYRAVKRTRGARGARGARGGEKGD